MTDYSYDYEWDERYCYPHSFVLKNKLGIKDSKALSVAERELTSLRLTAAMVKPIKGSFDFDHLRRIHRFIFGDIYTWAGKARTVNISKGNQFCLSHNIEMMASSIFDKLKKDNYLINSDNVPVRLAYYLSEINVLHPFREGNGRTQRLFIKYLASVAGYDVDYSLVSPKGMIIASAESFACEYGKINEMFERITKPIPLKKQKEAIALFFGPRSNEMKLFYQIHK